MYFSFKFIICFTEQEPNEGKGKITVFNNYGNKTDKIQNSKINHNGIIEFLKVSYVFNSILFKPNWFF